MTTTLADKCNYCLLKRIEDARCREEYWDERASIAVGEWVALCADLGRDRWCAFSDMAYSSGFVFMEATIRRVQRGDFYCVRNGVRGRRLSRARVDAIGALAHALTLLEGLK